MNKIKEKDISMGWILQSTRGNAGARIYGYNMHDALTEKGIKSDR